ncbi:MAG TPA: DUF554 domain-containing protein [Tissierellaceae bacterium]|nr:DUF554 domain-containing protein [Tissierellaceae bacterium]
MLGTIINSVSIIIGSLLGINIRGGIKEDSRNTIIDGIGLVVMVIGIMDGIKSENIVLVIISIVLGSLIGEIIGIEKRLNQFGNKMEKRFGKGNSNFAKGFITTSLISCIGAMSIVGALESGLRNDYSTLYIKSILDGISSIIFASTLGIGVGFAAIPVFIYQGSITILAYYLKDILTNTVILEMSSIGGILIMALGINLLDIKRIKVGNMLPAVFIPVIYQLLINLIAIIR